MKRLASLFLLLAPFAACTVGNVPDEEEIPDGVTCEKKVTGSDHGFHNSGATCLVGGACHKASETGAGDQGFLPLNGTVYEKSDGATTVEGATVTITWATGSKKWVSSAEGMNGGKGNILEYPAGVAEITFPATVKVSLCPTQEKVMATKLNNAGDLNCSRAGCHDANLRIYIK